MSLQEVVVQSRGASSVSERFQVESPSWRQTVELVCRQRGAGAQGLQDAYVELGADGCRVVLAGTRTSLVVRRGVERDAALPLLTTKGAPLQVEATAPAVLPAVVSAAEPAPTTIVAPASVVAPMAPPQEVAPAAAVAPVVVSAGEETLSDDALEDAFLEVPPTLEQIRELPDAIDYVMERSRFYVPAQCGLMLIANAASASLYIAQSWGLPSEVTRNLEFPQEEGFFGAVLRRGVGVTSAAPADDARYHALFTERTGVPMSTLLCVPIQSLGKSYGVLALINRQGGSHVFTQKELNLMSYLGEQMGACLQRAEEVD